MNEPFTVTEFSTMASGKSSWVAQLADIMLQRGTLIMSRTCYCKQDAEIDARALNAAYALGVQLVDAATPKQLDRDEMDHIAWLIFTLSEHNLWQRTGRKACLLCGLPARPHDETERRSLGTEYGAR